jgi:hypothetical protein
MQPLETRDTCEIRTWHECVFAIHVHLFYKPSGLVSKDDSKTKEEETGEYVMLDLGGKS